MKKMRTLKMFLTLVLLNSMIVIMANNANNQPSGCVSRINILTKTYFGDIDGDGVDDIVQFDKNRIFVAKNNESRDGILHVYLKSDIRRLVLGHFTTPPNGNRGDQVICLMANDSIEVFSQSTDNKELWWWFTQKSFIANNEEAIVGDFTADGLDDILVYCPYPESLRLYARSGNDPFFHQVVNFESLSTFDLNNKQIYVGEFGHEANRSDLLIVDRLSGQLTRYDAILENGIIKFQRSFQTSRDFLIQDVQVNVARIVNGQRDGVILSRGNDYRFYQCESRNGALVRIDNIAIGDLNAYPSAKPMIGRFSERTDPANNRDDIMLYNQGTDEFIRMDAKMDVSTGNATYQRAYTQETPKYNIGWPDRVVDKWLIVKCRLTNGPTAIPQNNEYYQNLFSEKGAPLSGMYNYLHNLSYGRVGIDATIVPDWETVSQTVDDSKGNGTPFIMVDRSLGSLDFFTFVKETQPDNTVFLKHLYTDKYITSNGTNNGDGFWGWAPIPSGHERYFKFLLINNGNNEYYLKHKFSERYLCSGENQNDKLFWMWAPIPQGHEDRYTFIFEQQNDGKILIKHKFSGKYLTNHRKGGRGELCQWCTTKHGYDNATLNQYKGVVSIYNMDGVDIGAIGNKVNLQSFAFHFNLVSHEMMHAYGLINHSFDENTPHTGWRLTGEYDDPFDVEGSDPDTTRFIGKFGSSGPGLHAVNLEKLRWLPSDRIKILPTDFTGSVELRLAALTRPECNGYLSVRVRIPATRGEEICLELRENSGFDRGFDRTAIYIRRYGISRGNTDQVNPVYTTYLKKDGSGPQFTAGESYTTLGVTINILDLDAANGTARIRISR